MVDTETNDHVVIETDDGWVLDSSQFVVAAGPWRPLATDYMVPVPYGVPLRVSGVDGDGDGDGEKRRRPRKRKRQQQQQQQRQEDEDGQCDNHAAGSSIDGKSSMATSGESSKVAMSTGASGSQQLQLMYEERRESIGRALTSLVGGSGWFDGGRRDAVQAAPPLGADRVDLAAFGQLAGMAMSARFGGGSNGGESAVVLAPPRATVDLAGMFDVELKNASADEAVIVRVVDSETSNNNSDNNKKDNNDNHSILAEFVLPQGATVVHGDAARLGGWLRRWQTKGRAFGVVLADPPWANRSAGRAGAFAQGRANDRWAADLAALPLAPLIPPGGLVAVWATNSRRVHSLVRGRVFASWKVLPAGEWLWIKVAASGEPVLPLGGNHRAPFECLLIGRRPLNDAQFTNHSRDNSHESRDESIEFNESNDSNPLNLFGADSRKVIVSVPSRRHSQKPRVHDLLARYAPAADPPHNCLELFARSAVPGWHAWGNESLKFNEVSVLDHPPSFSLHPPIMPSLP